MNVPVSAQPLSWQAVHWYFLRPADRDLSRQLPNAESPPNRNARYCAAAGKNSPSRSTMMMMNPASKTSAGIDDDDEPRAPKAPKTRDTKDCVPLAATQQGDPKGGGSAQGELPAQRDNTGPRRQGSSDVQFSGIGKPD